VMNDATGLDFMRARSYAPDIGRFVSFDPLPLAGANRYTYAKNQPVTGIDPSGLYCRSTTSTRVLGGIGILTGLLAVGGVAAAVIGAPTLVTGLLAFGAIQSALWGFGFGLVQLTTGDPKTPGGLGEAAIGGQKGKAIDLVAALLSPSKGA